MGKRDGRALCFNMCDILYLSKFRENRKKEKIIGFTCHVYRYFTHDKRCVLLENPENLIKNFI